MSGLQENQVANDGRIMGFSVVGLPTAILNTLQFDSVNNVFTWVAGSGGSMGDLEFLRGKQVAGDLLSAAGRTTAAAPSVACEIIPAVGKTFFIAKSNIQYDRAGTASSPNSAELQNDGTMKEIFINESGSTNNPSSKELSIVCDSLVGDGAKSYRIIKTGGVSPLAVSGVMLGWIENT